MNQHYDLYHHHGGLGMLSFSAPVSCHTDTRGEGGVYTDRPHIPWPPLCERTEETSCPALTQTTTPGLDHRHGSGEALTPCAVSFPRAGAQFPPTEPAACLLPALSACEKKWCCHSPLRRGQRASLPSRTPLLVPLWLAVAAAVRMWSPQRSALQPSASIGEEDEMFFPLPPVPLPPSEHHPLLHLPHRR